MTQMTIRCAYAVLRVRPPLADGRSSPAIFEPPFDEPAFAAALRADGPTLIHLSLDADVSTPRTTLTALRAAALKAG